MAEVACGVDMVMGGNDAVENGRADGTMDCESDTDASAAEAKTACKVRAGVGCTLLASGCGSKREEDEAENVPRGESSNNRPWDVDVVVGVAIDAGNGDGGRMWSTGLGTCCGDMVVEEMC